MCRLEWGIFHTSAWSRLRFGSVFVKNWNINSTLYINAIASYGIHCGKQPDVVDPVRIWECFWGRKFYIESSMYNHEGKPYWDNKTKILLLHKTKILNLFPKIPGGSSWHSSQFRQIANGRSNFESERHRCNIRHPPGGCYGTFTARRRNQANHSAWSPSRRFPSK